MIIAKESGIIDEFKNPESHEEQTRLENLEELLKRLQADNCKIVALEKTPNAINLNDFEPAFPMALILGNEVEGVSEEILKKCDSIVSIPMRGEKESLNVSVADGIAMYELLN